MFETISKGFQNIKHRLHGTRELNEDNIEDVLKDIRASLLEADVNFHVVKRFLAAVKQRALGEVVRLKVKDASGKMVNVTPAQHFIKICQEELVALMGPVEEQVLRTAPSGPTKIMMVGLQGSGKTTTAAKLAYWLMENRAAKPLLVAADVYRPAAIRQLQVLGETLKVPVYTEADADPVDICIEAVDFAKENGHDYVIFDTAGRLAVDDVLMSELEEIVEETKAENTFLVCDAMIGRDAVNTAVQFNERLDLDGFILTKLDGDARGGAALSIKEVTGKPIRFIGEGEQIDRLKEFRPDGLASRILGFGDIVDLMMDFERLVDEEQAEADAMDMLSGNFNFHHFLEQIETIQKMGSLRELMERMPFFSSIADKINVDDYELIRIKSLIQSMTEKERLRPDLMYSKGRQLRVARGSGRDTKEVADLMNRFSAMKEMMSRLGQNAGWMSKIPGLREVDAYRQMKNMDLNEVFGSIMQTATTPQMQQPMMALPPGLPRGYTPPGFKGQMARQAPKDKVKKKRKLARKARKEGRK
ncbi:MAG: signal recognition particle protein [Myxococcota bacterium]|nr:signal recognition particle protein [Myxococcota bacterium]